MARKKRPFRIEGSEKSARLDIRIHDSLREQLENYCIKHGMKITDAVTKALKLLIGEQNSEKKQ